MSIEKMFHDLEQAIEEDFAVESALEELNEGYRGNYLRLESAPRWTGRLREVLCLEVNGRHITLYEVAVSPLPYLVYCRAAGNPDSSGSSHSYPHLSDALEKVASILKEEKF